MSFVIEMQKLQLLLNVLLCIKKEEYVKKQMDCLTVVETQWLAYINTSIGNNLACAFVLHFIFCVVTTHRNFCHRMKMLYCLIIAPHFVMFFSVCFQCFFT